MLKKLQIVSKAFIISFFLITISNAELLAPRSDIEPVEVVGIQLLGLQKNEVATIRIGRSGDEKRKIESGGGKTTFEIEFQLIEEELPKSASFQSNNSSNRLRKEG